MIKLSKLKNVKSKGWLIIAGIVIFFAAVFIYYLLQTTSSSKENKEITVKSTSILFDQPKLRIFDDLLYLNQFPDTIRIHYPYFIVVKPEDNKSIIYNLDTKKKETESSQITLDYWQGNMLYNWHGLHTFYNKKDLGVHCDAGVIKSTNEVLCITAKANDPLDNKLISINVQTSAKNDVYSSANLLHSINIINGTVYIGEQNIQTTKDYLTVISTNPITSETASPVDIVYPMQDNIYYATFKGQNQNAQYYLLHMTTNGLYFDLHKVGAIDLYKD